MQCRNGRFVYDNFMNVPGIRGRYIQRNNSAAAVAKNTGFLFTGGI
jgi:hypothetical protein